MELRTARAGIATVAAVAAAALAGCSAGVDAGDTANSRSAAEVFLDLCAHQQAPELSALVNGPALTELVKAKNLVDGCWTIMRIPEDLPPTAFSHSEVTTVQTSGGESTVTIRVPGASRDGSLEIERHGDLWEVTNSSFQR